MRTGDVRSLEALDSNTRAEICEIQGECIEGSNDFFITKLHDLIFLIVVKV